MAWEYLSEAKYLQNAARAIYALTSCLRLFMMA